MRELCRLKQFSNPSESYIGRPRRRWEDNIRMELEEIGMGNWVDLAQDRDYWRVFVNEALSFRVP